MTAELDLEKILSDWSYWQNQPKATIQRAVLKRPIEWPADLVWIIQGVRRCGKSTLLHQIRDHLKLDPRACFFVNFEDPRLSERLNYQLLDEILTTVTRLRPGNGDHYFFFDEIQNVHQWEKWLHLQLERPRRNRFIITGSNASLLAGDLATALTGRHRTLELFPFTLNEYRAASPSETLEDYLQQGGFPRALSVSDSEALLREYFTDIIERDVRRQVAARSSMVLQQVAKAIYESTGSETSLRKLAKTTGLSVDTVHSYVDAFESAYMVLSCPYFTFSERKRLVRPSKYYPIDLGMHRSVISRGSLDQGKRLETAVFHFLRRKYGRVAYWKGKGEVDFVVQEGTDILPFQVSWDGAKDRHRNAIDEFKKEFPRAQECIFLDRNSAERLLRSEF